MAAAFCSRARERLPSMQLATGDSVTRIPLLRERGGAADRSEAEARPTIWMFLAIAERPSVTIHFASTAVPFCHLGNNETFSAFFTFPGHWCLGVSVVDVNLARSFGNIPTLGVWLG
ncbi:hypothetical protein K0M31_010534 [Melipona bicolor]|uniref:Uncharacterized protein n=1 Tax=Melipona bicolor TaxID=60889 RepID=A0AA40FM75_9HYME|nr:hypothetical protein K0M31_010534 [Melipona bicolor]